MRSKEYHVPHEENREIIRRFNEDVWGKGHVDLVDELFSPDFVDHYRAPGGPPGRDGIRYDVQRIRAAFPDLEIISEDIVCEEDRVALRWSGRGTHKQDLPGIPVTGRQITMSGMHFFRIGDSRIVERWVEFDGTAVMRQLGVV